MPEEIDPLIALEILPEKIRGVRKRITELLLDISVVEAIPDHSPEELMAFERGVRFQTAVLAGYEKRLAAIREAAQGKPE